MNMKVFSMKLNDQSINNNIKCKTFHSMSVQAGLGSFHL